MDQVLRQLARRGTRVLAYTIAWRVYRRRDAPVVAPLELERVRRVLQAQGRIAQLSFPEVLCCRVQSSNLPLIPLCNICSSELIIQYLDTISPSEAISQMCLLLVLCSSNDTMIDQAPSPQNCEWIVVPARLFTHDKMTFREDVVKPSRISPEALDEIYGKAVASKSEGHGGVVLCKGGLEE